MTVEINPNPALKITVDPTDTFADYQEKIIKKSKRQLRHGNGLPIELKPGSKYAVIALELAEIATPEQFGALMGGIMQALTQATVGGIIPPDWFKGVSTLFDLHPPEVPEQFQEEGYETKMFLSGETHFVVSKTPIPEAEPEVEVDE